MKEQQTNLLNFLQKNTLFPEGNRIHQRNRSRRSKDRHSLRDHQPPFFESRFQNRQTLSPMNETSPSLRGSHIKNYQQQRPQSFNVNRNYAYQSPQQIHQQKTLVRSSDYNILPRQEMIGPSDPLRTESLQCLYSITSKINGKIAETSRKLEGFRRKVTSWISQQLLKAQKQIVQMVQIAFIEQEKIIRQYVQKQEKTFNTHLLQVEEALRDERSRVDQLQKELRGKDWKATANQIKSFNLQRKIDQYLRETDRITTPQWTPYSFVGDHLQIIKLQLMQIFKLSTFAS